MARTITDVSPYPIARDRVVPLAEASVITGLSVDTLKRCGARNELKILKLSPRRVGIRLSSSGVCRWPRRLVCSLKKKNRRRDGLPNGEIKSIMMGDV
jgi:hypothetical protein